jgi:O-antigen/teichoic acid export membrane protein
MTTPSHHPAGPEEPASHRILQKFAWLLSARWAREALQAVFLIYLARTSTNSYGEFMLAIAMGQILVQVAEFGLNLPLVPMLSQKENDPGAALSQVTLLKGGLLILAFLGVLGFVHWQDYAGPLKGVIIVLAVGVGLEALAGTFFVACQVEGLQAQESKIRTLAAALGFSYGLITLILGAPPLVVAFFKLIETLTNLVGGAVRILSQARFRLRWPSLAGLRSTLLAVRVFAIMEVASTIYNKSNLFFLQRYAGADAVAQYSATWLTVDSTSGLVASLLLQSVLFPLFVRFWEVDRSKVSLLAQNTARWLLAVALPIMFFLFIESDRLILLVFGPAYQQAAWLQKLLVITVAFSFLHNLAAFLMISMRRERLLLIFYLAGLVFNLLWCTAIIPKIPLVGAALAIVLTKGLVALLSVSFCQVSLGLMPGRGLLQMGTAVLAGALCYFLGLRLFPREVAEVLALVPILALTWQWARDFYRDTHRAGA